jgi:AcrR family transcriptional regulator
MGVKERKERDKAEMRDMILQSAHKLFIDRGFEEVSIRNIAEAIEYSPATIYLYFKDKNEIFYALHNEAFKKFNAVMGEELATIADPFERLIGMGEMYIQFAMEHPKYYEIMFIMDAPMDCFENREEWEEGNKALGGLEQLLVACQATGRFKDQDPRVLAFSIWSYMHGMCSLSLRKRLRCYSVEDGQRIPKESFENFKMMLSKL